MFQIFEAVLYLHNHNIVHRDIKPENIMFASRPFFNPLTGKNNLHVKISDFGLSRVKGNKEVLTTLCGTPLYVAPEIATMTKKEIRRKRGQKKGGKEEEEEGGGGYGKEVDVWSVGVVMYVMLSGEPPFETGEEGGVGLWSQIENGGPGFEGEAWKKVSEEAKDLIGKLMVVNPKERITLEQALKHEWFTKQDKKRKVMGDDSRSNNNNSAGAINSEGGNTTVGSNSTSPGASRHRDKRAKTK
eukprot:TRINITY_DN6926_c0_g1_i1.p1 TRINITY_DN6926_c0_g1~~TRINITY_DN6926_c0_g1_i1.p1  ORF type:complete len:243 (-),score=96.20 TRINITY_DN6926_c0_g1_i1:28-756(-)